MGTARCFFNYWVTLNNELTYYLGGRETAGLTVTETL